MEIIKNKKWVKVLDKDGKSIHGGSMEWSLPNGVPGKWHEVEGEIKCCYNGLHFTCEPKKWIKKDCRFFIAELDFSEYDFENSENDDKICVRRGRLLRECSKEELYEFGIFISGVHALSNGMFYVAGNAKVTAWGNATVEARGNATVEAWGNATVEACDNAKVEAWDNAKVEAWGNAKVTAWGNAYLLFYNDESYHTIADNAIKKSYSDNRIWMKKGSHTIVEVD